MSAAASLAGSRHIRVFDGDGSFVGDFASWLVAHRWAHQRAQEPGTRLPVELQDRSRLCTEQVWPDRCQSLHATEPVIVPTCPLTAASAPALPAPACGVDPGSAATTTSVAGSRATARSTSRAGSR